MVSGTVVDMFLGTVVVLAVILTTNQNTLHNTCIYTCDNIHIRTPHAHTHTRVLFLFVSPYFFPFFLLHHAFSLFCRLHNRTVYRLHRRNRSTSILLPSKIKHHRIRTTTTTKKKRVLWMDDERYHHGHLLFTCWSALGHE